MNENQNVEVSTETVNIKEAVIKSPQEIVYDEALRLIRDTELRFNEETLKTYVDADGITKVAVSDEFAENFKRFTQLQEKMEASLATFRKYMTEFLETNNIKEKQENNGLKFQYTSASTRTSIDSSKLRKELPAVADLYSKTTNVSATSKISVIEEEPYKW